MEWPNSEMPLIVGLILGSLLKLEKDFSVISRIEPVIDDDGALTNVVKIATSRASYDLTLTPTPTTG